MPRKVAPSQKGISKAIGFFMREYNKTGKIGNITPRNKAHAMEVAQGRAYAQARQAGFKG